MWGGPDGRTTAPPGCGEDQRPSRGSFAAPRLSVSRSVSRGAEREKEPPVEIEGGSLTTDEIKK